METVGHLIGTLRVSCGKEDDEKPNQIHSMDMGTDRQLSKEETFNWK